MASAEPTQPDLSVETTTDARGLVLRLTSTRIDQPLTIELSTAHALRRRCAILGRELNRMAQPIRATGRTDVTTAGTMLEELAAAGRIFLGYVLRRPRSLPELSNYLRSACPTWQAPQLRRPLIHAIATPDQYFPWELLPLFGPFDPIDVNDQTQLERSSLRYPGFAAIVERIDPDNIANASDLDGWHPIPTRVIYHGGLRGAHAEVGFFRGKGHVFRLEGPYPNDVSDTEAPTLAHQIAAPHVSVGGGVNPYADQLLHVACHCEANGDDASQFAYRLADRHGREMVISLDDLMGELMRHWGARDTGGDRAAMPLAFLNACGTAIIDPAGAASLLKPFRDNGNRGIVGTAANVPDRVAANMSRWFYTNLTVGGLNLGNALHQAKWRLLQDHGNPLGILYAVHAFAGLRVIPIPPQRTSSDPEASNE